MDWINANLNPCPLCGRAAHIWQAWDSEYQAECAFCGVRSLSSPELNKAVGNWNSQSKKKYTRTEKKQQKLVTAGQNLGHHLWDYNSKGTLIQMGDNKWK